MRSSRRQGSRALVSAGIAITLFALLHCAPAEPIVTPERIILIVVDTLRRDHVSAYAAAAATKDVDPLGNAPARTPNIDRLAARGQIFNNAISAYHSTTMSMASLFTGRTPSIESGERDNPIDWNTFAACGMSRFAGTGDDNACVPNSMDTLAEDLQAAGYWTLGVVSNELLYRPGGYDQGFDQWIEVGLPPPGETLNIFKASPIRTVRHVNKDALLALSNRPNDRFFLYLHYIDVHDWSLFRRSYKKAVQMFDKQLGNLLDQLEADGLLENTTVILTSDHGEMLIDSHLNMKTLRHYGNPSFEPVLQIPLIVSPAIKANTSALVRTQDLRGMIRRIAGIRTELEPDLEDGELFVSERLYQNYRKGRWKSLWQRNSDRRLLFDLVSDPGENVDLAARRSDILEVHAKRIDEISRAMASDNTGAQDLSEQDLDRLRALGYIDSVRASPPAPN